MLYKVTLNRFVLNGDYEDGFKSASDIRILRKVLIKAGGYESRMTKRRDQMRRYGVELIGSFESKESICRHNHAYNYIIDLEYAGESSLFLTLRYLLRDDIRMHNINRLIG